MNTMGIGHWGRPVKLRVSMERVREEERERSVVVDTKHTRYQMNFIFIIFFMVFLPKPQ